jgi:GR25 family glycosyltransferase involved in LPS biosynthesis
LEEVQTRMKAVVIYLEHHKDSIAQAKACIDSCVKYEYDVTTLKASEPNNLKCDFSFDIMKDSRVKALPRDRFANKQACFASHYRCWKHVIDTGKPLLILEHDAIAIKKWDNPEYDEVLCLNMKNAMNRTIFNSTRAPESAYKFNGSLNLEDSKSNLKYNRNNIFKDSYMIPGCASYVINPHGAIKLLKSIVEHGWEQNDYLINTSVVDIKYTVPDYFSLNKNLQTSHRT